MGERVMINAWKTEKGIVKSIDSGYLSEDEEYFSNRSVEVDYYEKYGIKDILSRFPKEIIINEQEEKYLLKYPEISPRDNTLNYTLTDTSGYYDISVEYKIEKDKVVFIEATEWCRCSELNEEKDLREILSKPEEIHILKI
jgi:hypothetical protein